MSKGCKLTCVRKVGETMLEHKGTKTIITDRLILRRFIESDAQDMFNNWANDDDVTRYLTWPTHKDVNVSKSVLTEWMNSYKNIEFYQWAITIKYNDEVIGSIGVVNLSNYHEHCEIGYCIGKSFWGQGIMTEALRGIISYLFDEVGFKRVEAIHHSQNIASGKVMKKAGMQYEGIKRKFHKNRDNIFVDCDSYAIISKD